MIDHNKKIRKNNYVKTIKFDKTSKEYLVNAQLGTWCKYTTLRKDILARLDKRSTKIDNVLNKLYNVEQEKVSNEIKRLIDIGIIDIKGQTATSLNKKKDKRPKDIRVQCLVIKIANTCNLKCSYCYRKFLTTSNRVNYMSPQILMNIIKKAIKYSERHGMMSLHFHGGEPLLNFKTISYVFDKITGKGYSLNNVVFGLTTNGTLITDEIAADAFKYKLHFEISMDGPKAFHDRQRKDKVGRGSLSRILEGLKILRRHGNEIVSSTTVVTSLNVRKLDTVFNFLVENGMRFLGFNIVRCPDSNNKLIPSVNDIKWGYHNLIQALIEHNKRNKKMVYIPEIVALTLNLLSSKRVYLCRMDPCGAGSRLLDIETDGTVYPCDQLVEEGNELGKIQCNTFKELITTPISKGLQNRSADKIQQCRKCIYKRFCCGFSPCNEYHPHFSRYTRNKCEYSKYILSLLMDKISEDSDNILYLLGNYGEAGDQSFSSFRGKS